MSFRMALLLFGRILETPDMLKMIFLSSDMNTGIELQISAFLRGMVVVISPTACVTGYFFSFFCSG
ncbi:MAG: hypothetical protein EBZ31_07315 [Flavobacteriia bacterium]|nr:hypothetical protein [Flavobacteriia bacterium]